MPVHAVNVEGVAYRSYRLIEVKHAQWTDKSIRHCAVNKKKNVNSKSTHLGPHRAAQKIFDAWCRSHALNDVSETRFIIQETTRGKKNKLFVYDGRRLKLDTPRVVTVHNKKSNKDYTITYEHQSKVKACKKSEMHEVYNNEHAVSAEKNTKAKAKTSTKKKTSAKTKKPVKKATTVALT